MPLKQPWNLHDDTFLFEIRDDDRHCTVCGIIIGIYTSELGVEGYGTYAIHICQEITFTLKNHSYFLIHLSE